MGSWSPESENSFLFWVGLPAACILFIVNIPLLVTVWKKSKSTLIDQMIGVDCLVALLHVPLVLESARIVIQPCWSRKDATYFFCLRLYTELLVQACLRAPPMVTDEAKLAIVFTYNP